MTIAKVINIVFDVNWLKTLIFNLHYFPIKQSYKFPVFVYRRTVLRELKGHIIIKGPVKTGMVRIGIPRIGIQDHRYNRTIWANGGGQFYH